MNDKISVNLHSGDSLQIIAAPHNLRFESIDNRSFVFRAIRYPYKKLINDLIAQENGNIQNVQAFICIQISRNESNLFVEIRYSVKTWKDRKSYVLMEKVERFFDVDADKSQVIRIVEPYLSEAFHVFPKVTANNMIRYFTEWAYPPKLEELIRGLTDDQRRQVARYIKKIAA